MDINPGDRENTCRGLMEPVFAEVDSKKGFIIHHRCIRCGEVKRNRAAHEAGVQPDNRMLLIRLTAGQRES